MIWPHVRMALMRIDNAMSIRHEQPSTTCCWYHSHSGIEWWELSPDKILAIRFLNPESCTVCTFNTISYFILKTTQTLFRIETMTRHLFCRVEAVCHNSEIDMHHCVQNESWPSAGVLIVDIGFVNESIVWHCQRAFTVYINPIYLTKGFDVLSFTVVARLFTVR